MALSIQIPSLGESVTSAVLVKWHKKTGDNVVRDEAVCELETDKANVDLPAPADGVITCTVDEGATVKIGQEVATVGESGAESPEAPPAPPATAASPRAVSSALKPLSAAPVDSAPASPTADAPARPTPVPPALVPRASHVPTVSPVAQRVAADTGINPATIPGSGPHGRVVKQDILSAAGNRGAGRRESVTSPKSAAIPEPSGQRADLGAAASAAAPANALAPGADQAGVRYEPMSKLRLKIAERLVAAQQTAAILTTFNEIDLSAVQELRARYKERFTEIHGVGLGLMSFFVRGCVLALREFPRINAFIDGTNVVYHDYVHVGIAVSTERGLAVPVMRNADALSFAQIESEVRRLATAAREGKLAIDDLSGGTFSITNGGIFGSLLSTPILNPPQSGILGMHAIQRRPVAIGEKIEIRPMMYVALSYDHRLVDGRESVSFLVRLKQLVEDPSRLMLEV